MNDRKRNVIEKAHELFIEKGFHSTSIQDILDYSGISKGTFYNYFISKNELLMEIFRGAFRKMEIARDALLLGQEASDPEVFMNQIELQMTANRENKIIPLFEEVYFSGDKELKQFVEIGQMNILRWFSDRLANITDDHCSPYMLDAAIMLNAMLIQYVRFYRKAYGNSASTFPVVRYSVNRILTLMEEVTLSQEQLLSPKLLDVWLPVSNRETLDWRSNIHSVISRLKKLDCKNKDHLQKLTFLEEELRSKEPRKFLIDSIVFTMSADFNRETQELQALIDEHLLEKA